MSEITKQDIEAINKKIDSLIELCSANAKQPLFYVGYRSVCAAIGVSKPVLMQLINLGYITPQQANPKNAQHNTALLFSSKEVMQLPDKLGKVIIKRK